MRHGRGGKRRRTHAPQPAWNARQASMPLRSLGEVLRQAREAKERRQAEKEPRS